MRLLVQWRDSSSRNGCVGGSILLLRMQLLRSLLLASLLRVLHACLQGCVLLWALADHLLDHYIQDVQAQREQKKSRGEVLVSDF